LGESGTSRRQRGGGGSAGSQIVPKVNVEKEDRGGRHGQIRLGLARENLVARKRLRGCGGKEKERSKKVGGGVMGGQAAKKDPGKPHGGRKAGANEMRTDRRRGGKELGEKGDLEHYEAQYPIYFLDT